MLFTPLKLWYTFLTRTNRSEIPDTVRENKAWRFAALMTCAVCLIIGVYPLCDILYTTLSAEDGAILPGPSAVDIVLLLIVGVILLLFIVELLIWHVIYSNRVYTEKMLKCYDQGTRPSQTFETYPLSKDVTNV